MKTGLDHVELACTQNAEQMFANPFIYERPDMGGGDNTVNGSSAGLIAYMECPFIELGVIGAAATVEIECVAYGNVIPTTTGIAQTFGHVEVSYPIEWSSLFPAMVTAFGGAGKSYSQSTMERLAKSKGIHPSATEAIHESATNPVPGPGEANTANTGPQARSDFWSRETAIKYANKFTKIGVSGIMAGVREYHNSGRYTDAMRAGLVQAAYDTLAMDPKEALEANDKAGSFPVHYPGTSAHVSLDSSGTLLIKDLDGERFSWHDVSNAGARHYHNEL